MTAELERPLEQSDGAVHPFEMDAGFRSIFEAAPYGMLLVDATGHITEVNSRIQEMFGYAPEELLGRTIEVLVPERYRGAHRGMRDDYAQAPSMRSMGQGRDLTGLRRDGVEFPLEIGLNAIETKFGRMTCASIIDITERKRNELRLREANAQLEEFTYVASHDLRSPIRGIANLLDFVREDLGGDCPADVSRNFDRMQERIAIMEALIGDLLTYARAGRRMARIEPVDLLSLIEELVELESPPEGMQVLIDVSCRNFDAARTPLETVIRNLLSNAIKHHDKEEGTITITAETVGNMVRIDVRDDGPGIPESAQARVFRLFQTLSASVRKGSGLGLAVVQRLVEGHGGSISLTSSSERRGAVFSVLWPRFARTDLDD